MEKTTPKTKVTTTSLTPPKAATAKKATKAPQKAATAKTPKKTEAKPSTATVKPVKVNDSFIKIKNLTKYYINSKSEIVTALENVSITLPSTGFVYLKGESGSGKSTLLNILGALDSYDKGDMIVEGLSFKDLSFKVLDDWRANQTAFVFQDFNLLSDFTVAENIRLGSNFAGMDITNEQISDVLSKVGLKGFENRSVGQLSGGERQRVSIARALVKTPRILLVDEPTGQINVENAEKVFSILKDISKETLVVCVSYDENVKKYVDREITLSKGKIVSDVVVKRKKEEKIEVGDSGLRNLTKKQNYVEGSPISHILRIGTRNVTGKRKWRTVVLVLLTTFSLLFGSVLYMLSGYSMHEALAKSVELENSAYMLFEADDPVDVYIKHSATTNKSTMLKLDFVKHQFISGIIETIAPNNNEVGGYNALGQKILHGAYPTQETNSAGVVITDYIASRVVDKENRVIDEENFGDLIGERIIYRNGRFQILDIEDTSDLIYNDSFKVAAIVETDYKTLDRNSQQYKYNEENVYKMIHAAPQFHTAFTRHTQNNTVVIGEGENEKEFSNVEFYDIAAFIINNDKRLEADKLKAMDGSSITQVANGALFISKGLYELVPNNSMKRLRVGNLDKEYSVNDLSRVIDTDEPIIIFSNNDFTNDICKKVEFPASGVVLSVEDMNVRELTNVIESLDKNYGATLVSPSSAEIIDFSEKLQIFKTAILIFTVVAIVLTMALFYNFITLTIIDNKKNIGVLRSLGASGGNIATIFSTTIGIIIIACTLFTSALSVATAAIINSVVLKSMNVPFHIIVFNPAIFGIIFFICLFIGVMATAIPIIRYSKQSPICQIKGNRIFRLKNEKIKL